MKTQRGFVYNNFKDYAGNKCSIQESSAYHKEKLIWIGCDDIGLMKFTPYSKNGWEEVILEQKPNGISYVANNKMHLTQSQVAKLLPILKYFVENGTLQE